MQSTEPMEYDIVIVGLGPVGALAGNLAGAAGFKTLIVERADTPYLKPRAIVFDAEVMRIFNSVGLSENIAAATKPLEGSVYLGADRKPIRTFRTRPQAHGLEWRSTNLFYQPDLETILRAGLKRFANVTVLLEHEAGALRQDEASAHLVIRSLRDGQALEASCAYLLACDGASSGIRKQLGIALDDIGFEERWLVVDTLIDGPMRWPSAYEIPSEVRNNQYSLMVCDPARPSTLIPGVGRHRRWELMLLAGESDEDAVSDNRLRELIGLWIDPADVEIIRAAVYRFRALVAERWRAGRAFLMGDAAHQTPPFFGQGMCHGMRDAAQLLWRLKLVRDGLADAGTLDEYQLEREPHVRAIITASVAAGAAVCKLDPVEAAKRDADFRAAEAARGETTVAMADVVPPLAQGLIDPRTGGARFPDFAVRAPNGEPQRLDDLLGGGFAIVTIMSEAAEHLPPRWRDLGARVLVVDDGNGVADVDGRLARWFAEREAHWAIVRPDRYVYATGVDISDLASHVVHLLERLHERRTAHDSPASRHTKTWG
ncbi:MAG TPA: bifunctional 3-(3-hydroxy-phenyl)propionate/3-hydroxycinnamic acid hydroxylase [Caulobacterales bacterium]|nr:bifunctional 3-(3-hydroxy-phenyl)propionate/3-hydroxycinnamic acid hydroxylase [Caulobacterales bacterium]